LKSIIRVFWTVLIVVTITACGNSSGPANSEEANDTKDAVVTEESPGSSSGSDIEEETADTPPDTRIAANLIESQLRALYDSEITKMLEDSDEIKASRAGAGAFRSSGTLKLLHENFIVHVKLFLNDTIQYIEQLSNRYPIKNNEVKQLVGKYKQHFIVDYLDSIPEFNSNDIILDRDRIDNEFLMIFNEIELLLN